MHFSLASILFAIFALCCKYIEIFAMRVHYEIRMEKLFRNISIHMYMKINMHILYMFIPISECVM